MFHTLDEALATFDYHKPNDGQVERIATIRRAAKAFVTVIWMNAPDGADRTVAVRKAHEAMMTANKAIVLEGEVSG